MNNIRSHQEYDILFLHSANPKPKIHQCILIFAYAGLMTLTSFIVMSSLINKHGVIEEKSQTKFTFDIFRHIIEKPPKNIIRKILEEEPPKPLFSPINHLITPNVASIKENSISKPDILHDSFGNMKIDLSAANIRQPLPIQRAKPSYPSAARQAGVIGYVLLEFTINKRGSTEDIKIIEANPAGYFEQSALSAMKRLRYRPIKVDGKAIRLPNMRYQFTFQKY